MLALLAILFPLLCTAFLPDIYKEIERDFPDDNSRADDAGKTGQASVGLYLLWSLLLAPVLGLLQWGLFRLARDHSPLFSNRASDLFVYGLIPGLLLAFVLATLPVYYHARRKYGDRFRDHLNATHRGASNREGYRGFRPLALSMGIGLSILNFLVHDCFISIDREALRYSGFWSVVSNRVPVSEIVSATKYQWRVPNRGKSNRPYLKLKLRDGSAIDTSYLESVEIPKVLQALEQARGEALPVTIHEWR